VVALSTDGVSALVEARCAELRECAPRTAALLDAEPPLAREARAVLAASDFAFATLLRDDELLEALWKDGDLGRPRTAEQFNAQLAAAVDAAAGEAAVQRALRQLRTRELQRQARHCARPPGSRTRP
jgi:glutamine synthetase adenylyltransferase